MTLHPSQVAINGERPWVDPDCPEPLRRLITKCWHQDPHVSGRRIARGNAVRGTGVLMHRARVLQAGVVVRALLGRQFRGLGGWHVAP